MDLKWLVMLAALLLSFSLSAKELHIAVASNFAPTLSALSTRYTEVTGHAIKVSSGSTGKLYAQIMHGAPFDLFFAADTDRPQRLEQDNKIIPRTRATYALGQLVLWSPHHDSEQLLSSQQFRYLAIANPKHAPYGVAAQQVLEKLDVWQPLQARIVRGENINQAFQYVKTGNAELGFVALSQVHAAMLEQTKQFWLIPEQWYTAVEQQVVQITEHENAADFLAFVFSEQGQQLIMEQGYKLP